MGHRDSQLTLATRFDARPSRQAKQIGHPQSLYFRGPDFVAARISLKFNNVESAVSENGCNFARADSADTDVAQKLAVTLKTHRTPRTKRERSGHQVRHRDTESAG